MRGRRRRFKRMRKKRREKERRYTLRLGVHVIALTSKYEINTALLGSSP